MRITDSMLRTLQACPRHLLVCEKSSFLQDKSKHSVQVQTHYYNCCVSILLPECGRLPQQIENTISNFGKFYLVKNLPLYEFVTEDFINSFLKKGSFYALSYKTRIDQDNTAALLPTGKLIISVDKDTYEELGLKGHPSLHSGKKAMRFIINLDLTDQDFAPEGKKYKRVNWSLSEKNPLAFDFLLALENIDSPSITSYFSKYNVKEFDLNVSTSVFKDLHCPVLKSGELQGKPDESCSCEELFEWLGAVSNNIDCNNSSSSFISTYCCPHPNIVVQQAHLCTITGFITPEKIQILLQLLRDYFTEPKLTQWAALTVHGFADSPVSWKENEHGFHKGGENLYSFVVFDNEDYWLQMAVGTHDGCP